MCPVIQTPSVAKSGSKQVREENMPTMIVNNHGASQVSDRQMWEALQPKKRLRAPRTKNIFEHHEHHQHRQEQHLGHLVLSRLFLQLQIPRIHVVLPPGTLDWYPGQLLPCGCPVIVQDSIRCSTMAELPALPQPLEPRSSPWWVRGAPW